MFKKKVEKVDWSGDATFYLTAEGKIKYNLDALNFGSSYTAAVTFKKHVVINDKHFKWTDRNSYRRLPFALSRDMEAICGQFGTWEFGVWNFSLMSDTMEDAEAELREKFIERLERTAEVFNSDFCKTVTLTDGSNSDKLLSGTVKIEPRPGMYV